MTSSWFLRQGSLHAILRNEFWKSDHDFLIAFHSNFLSVMHGFRDNEVLLQARYDVIVISPPGGASRYFTWRILKRRPRLYIHVQLTLFVYLERFRSYSTFLIWLGFPYWGRNFGGFWAKWPQNVKLEKNTCWEGTSLRQTAYLEPLCVKLSLSVRAGLCRPVQVRKKKRQTGR